MNEEKFWKVTPRVFDELLKVHKKLNGLEENEDKADGYIDDILF